MILGTEEFIRAEVAHRFDRAQSAWRGSRRPATLRPSREVDREVRRERQPAHA